MVPPSSSIVGSSTVSSAFTMNTLGGNSEPNQVMAFLKEYRVLECSCCTGVFGFQHKITGALFCAGGCHERTPPTPVSGRLNSFPSVLMATPFMNLSLETPASTKQALSANIAEKSEPAVVPGQTEKVRPLVPAAAQIEKPKAEATPVPKPEASKPQVVPTRVVEKTKPVLPRPPELAKPKVEEPKRYMWTQMKYSENLVRPDAPVTVCFAWDPMTYTVSSDADEIPIQTLQTTLKQHEATVKRMQHAPIKDEIVIGEYEGDYYRARVMNVEGENCDLKFIDFGDKKTSKITELIPVNDAIMKYPVFGMIVHLKLQFSVEGFIFTSAIEDLVYGGPWILDMKKGTVPEPGRAESYEVRMWDLEKEDTLNEKLTTAFTSATHPDGGWNFEKPDEQKEIAYFMSISSHFAETKRLVEEEKSKEASQKNISNRYVFKLDNADYTYSIQDLPLIKSSNVKGEVEVEITKFKTLSNIVALPVGKFYEDVRNDLNKNIERWIETRSKRQLDGLQRDFIPEYDEMCIVQWPPWESVNFRMEKLHGEKWKYDYIDEHQLDLDIFKGDYEKYAGKWFRASCACITDSSKYVRKTDDQTEIIYYDLIYQMFLVDLGKTTLIPAEYVFRMPHRFMIDAQTSVFLSLQLDEITQYSNNTDEKWKYLLLPGLKVKVKFHWMFDEINIVTLIAPSENDFQEHFRKPEVQEGIERQKANVEDRRRHRKVRKMSGMKGTFPKNMELVLADEIANEKLLKLLRDEYSDFSRVHPDRIFQLCLPYVS